MLKKFRTIVFLMSFVVFIFLTVNYYFSKENVIHINKLRSIYILKSYIDLPLLTSDTNNIIIYKNDLEEFKKKRKKRFWEKLISDEN